MARAGSPQNRRARVSLTIATGFRSPVVARLELAAGDQANLQGREVVGADGVRQECQVLVGTRLVALDPDALRPRIDERHRVRRGQRRRLDAGLGADGRQEVVEERPAACLVVPARLEVQADRDDVGGVEAGVGGTSRVEASRDEPGPDEQQHRDRHLRRRPGRRGRAPSRRPRRDSPSLMTASRSIRAPRQAGAKPKARALAHAASTEKAIT